MEQPLIKPILIPSLFKLLRVSRPHLSGLGSENIIQECLGGLHYFGTFCGDTDRAADIFDTGLNVSEFAEFPLVKGVEPLFGRILLWGAPKLKSHFPDALVLSKRNMSTKVP